jgi:hypothetical protein
MDNYTVFPDKKIKAARQVSDRFLALGIDTFIDACRFVHDLPYGYNSDRDDLMILFIFSKRPCIFLIRPYAFSICNNVHHGQSHAPFRPPAPSF